MLKSFYKIVSGIGLLGILSAGCGHFKGYSSEYRAMSNSIEQETIGLLKESSPKRNEAYKTSLETKAYDIPWKKFTDGENSRIQYRVRHLNPEDLVKALKSQYPELKNIHLVNKTNNLLVTLPSEDSNFEEGFRKYVESLDEKFPSIRLDVSIITTFGDYTIDRKIRTRLETLLGRKGVSPIADVTLPGADLRNKTRSTFGAKYGIVRLTDGTRLTLEIDELESWGFVKREIIGNYTVSSGETAKISSLQKIPIRKDVLSGNNVLIITGFEEVPTSIDITPYVQADGEIYLTINSKVSSTTPTGPSQELKINSDSIEIGGISLMNGEPYIVGGFFRNNEEGVDRGVPFFRKLPLIGLLSSSKDYERSKERIFFEITSWLVESGQNTFNSPRREILSVLPPESYWFPK